MNPSPLYCIYCPYLPSIWTRCAFITLTILATATLAPTASSLSPTKIPLPIENATPGRTDTRVAPSI